MERVPYSRPRHQAPTLPRIAALYCRVSSKQQADDDRHKTSLKTQLAALQMKAAEMGYAIAPEYTYMEAFNGEELIERPELSHLRDDAKERRFAIVLAYNVYALAKNQAHLAILHDEWQRLGVALDFVTEQLEDTPIGRAILALHAFAAEVEGERRKDRVSRARIARVKGGRAAVGHRPNYGYQWSDTRLPDGRLARERLDVNPETAPIVVRMFEMIDSGHTLRAIAAQFTSEGIPTPTGKWVAWDITTIHALVLNPLYIGRPMALKRKCIPVDKTVRHLYARRSREVPRPIEEQIELPASYAPPLVSPELFARVAERMRLNKQLAARNNRQPAATLVRGLIRCGYCGAAIITVNSTRQGTIYRCQMASRLHKGDASIPACPSRGMPIVSRKVDDAVWAKVTEVLTKPDLIAQEVARMQTMDDPRADLLAGVERQIAETERRIANKRKFAELVNDDDERAELAAEVKKLREDLRTHAAERVAINARLGAWRNQQDGLERTLDYCARVSGKSHPLPRRSAERRS
jgi:site-specific DNA recombinase